LLFFKVSLDLKFSTAPIVYFNTYEVEIRNLLFDVIPIIPYLGRFKGHA
jgi:hypothetical protein